MKCNRCSLAIDPTRDAFVVMPNPEQCGKGAFRPTRHAHASCFERDVKAAYKQELELNAERQKEIDEARGHHSFS